MTKRKLWLMICAWVLVGLCIAFIWGNSMQKGEDSSKVSSSIAQIPSDIIQAVKPETDKPSTNNPNTEKPDVGSPDTEPVTEAPETDKRDNPIFKATHHFVRKAAHFAEYAMLSVLFCFAFRFTQRKKGEDNYIPIYKDFSLLALPCSILVAATDEGIQHFTEGRNGNIRDIMLDSCGALCALVIFFAVLFIVERRNKMIKEK